MTGWLFDRNTNQDFDRHWFSIAHGRFEPPLAECCARRFVHFWQYSLVNFKMLDNPVASQSALQHDHLVSLLWRHRHPAEVESGFDIGWYQPWLKMNHSRAFCRRGLFGCIWLHTILHRPTFSGHW